MILWSVETLQRHLHHDRLRLADVRWVLGQPGAGGAAYDAGHLPGAIHLDIDTDLVDPSGLGAPGRHPLPDPVAFAARLGALGIGTGSVVVAYDDAGGGHAARLWWMLDALGFREAHMLDGGIDAWTSAGLPLTTDMPTWTPAKLELADAWGGVIGREALAARLGGVVVLDARAPERYRGEVEPMDPVAGHIPTARSAPTAGNLGPDGRFLAPEALASRFADLGVGESDVISYCGSGITACQNALALRVAGRPAPLLYAGSYSDWSRSGMPVATGPAPGDPPT